MTEETPLARDREKLSAIMLKVLEDHPLGLNDSEWFTDTLLNLDTIEPMGAMRVASLWDEFQELRDKLYVNDVIGRMVFSVRGAQMMTWFPSCVKFIAFHEGKDTPK